ncbi:MFS transporter [Candidatus Dojkabacteria bacterium]|jgi:MFS family permease|nr:MFS transporter [Candidatus Dojkabacteria bacterium]
MIFWIPVAVLYFQYRGLSLSQMYWIVSLQSLLVVVLEYPTGVIGDYFGHKTSVFWGYIFTGLGLMLVSLNLPFWGYCLVFSLTSLGGALTSGSDIALLYSVSKDFKKDSAWIGSVTGIIFPVTVALSGIIGRWSLPITFFLSGATTIASAVFIFFIKHKVVKKKKGNIFSTAKKGLIEVNTNRNVSFIIYSSAVILMYGLSQKWIITPSFERINIGVEYYGLIFAALSLVMGQAGQIYKRVGHIKEWILLLVCFIASVLVVFKFISIPMIFIIYLIFGYYKFQSDIVINKFIEGSVRASALSYRSLIAKLLEFGFIAIVGVLVLKLSFEYATIVISIIIGLLILLSYILPFLIRKKQVKLV